MIEALAVFEQVPRTANTVVMTRRTKNVIARECYEVASYMPLLIGDSSLMGFDVKYDPNMGFGEFRFENRPHVACIEERGKFEHKCWLCGAPNNGNDPAVCSYCGSFIKKEKTQ